MNQMNDGTLTNFSHPAALMAPGRPTVIRRPNATVYPLACAGHCKVLQIGFSINPEPNPEAIK